MLITEQLSFLSSSIAVRKEREKYFWENNSAATISE